jgi:hypothetical protein
MPNTIDELLQTSPKQNKIDNLLQATPKQKPLVEKSTEVEEAPSKTNKLNELLMQIKPQKTSEGVFPEDVLRTIRAEQEQRRQLEYPTEQYDYLPEKIKRLPHLMRLSPEDIAQYLIVDSAQKAFRGKNPQQKAFFLQLKEDFIKDQKIGEFDLQTLTRNARRNTVELIEGLSVIGVAGIYAATHPLKTAELVAKTVSDPDSYVAAYNFSKNVIAPGIKNWASHFEGRDAFMEYFYTQPIDAAIDMSVFADLAGLALKGLAAGTKTLGPFANQVKLGRHTTDQFAAFMEKAGKYVRPSEIRQTALELTLKTEGGRAYVTRREAIGLGKSLQQEYRNKWFTRANAEMGEVSNIVKKLPKADYENFVKALQDPISVTTKTPELDHSLKLYDKWQKFKEYQVLEGGILKPQALLEAKWKPLAKNKGLLITQEEVQEQLNVLRKTGRYTEEQLDEAYAALGPQVGTLKEGAIQQLKDAGYVDDMEPIYFREMISTEPKAKYGGLPPTRTGAVKARFMRKRKEVGGYSVNVPRVMERHAADINQYTLYKEKLKDITTNPKYSGVVKRIKPSDVPKDPDIGAGWVLWEPERHIRLYKGALDSTSAGLDKALITGDLNAGIEEALRVGLEQGKSYMGATTKGIPLYKIERNFMNELSRTTPHNNFTVIYDKMTDLWRVGVLAARPAWQVVNMLGLTFIAALRGDLPEVAKFVLKKKYRDAWMKVVPTDAKFGLYSHGASTYRPPPITFSGQLIRKIEDLPPMKVGRSASKFLYDVNRTMDDLYRGAAYVKSVKGEARKAINKRTAIEKKNFSEMAESWYGLHRQSEKFFKPEPLGVKEQFLHQEATLPGWQKVVARRVFPFWNWAKYASRMAASLPVLHPYRTELLKSIAKVTYDATNQESLPPYLRGSIRIDHDSQTGEDILLSGKYLMPLQTVTQAWQFLSLAHPAITTAFSQWGLEAPIRTFGKPEFTAPAGEKYDIDPRTGEYERVGVGPPLLEAIARNFPQYQALEDMLYPYKKYDTSTLLDPKPMRDEFGQLQIRPRSERLFRYLGYPVKRYHPLRYKQRLSKQRKLAIGDQFNDLMNDPETFKYFNRMWLPEYMNAKSRKK